MPYIGNDLATQFQAFATQTITGDGSTGYTLDRAVANGKELLVYINNVKQEEGSGKSYTASGTTITFSEAVASGDSCYLVYMGSAQQTVTAPAGSIVSSQFSSADLSLTGNVGIGISSPNTALHLFASTGDVGITVQSSATANAKAFIDLFGRDSSNVNQIWKIENNAHNLTFNDDGTEVMRIDSTGAITKPLQPAFHVQHDAEQNNISNDTAVTFPTEVFDQNGDFASNTFTAPVTGRYQLQCMVRMDNLVTGINYYGISVGTSNRSYQHIFQAFDNISYKTMQVSVLADMDANDTAVINFSQSGGSAHADLTGDAMRSNFSGYLVA
jgi:hypothetical protein